VFSIYSKKLRDEAETIKSVLATHDQIRSLMYSSDGVIIPSAGVDPLVILKATAPPLLAWRIYDHCAAYTRLYAIYEQFIRDIVSAWLKTLPDLYRQYQSLPEGIRRGHRIGVSELLSRLTSGRYDHLSEQVVLQGIHEGVTGKTPYTLLADAFILDGPNYRAEILKELFARVGISDGWAWVSTHGMIQRFIEDECGESSSAESELRSLVQNRNNAAHGEVDEIVGMDDLKKVADFIISLCSVIAELFMSKVVERRIELGQVTRVGSVIHEFSNSVVGVQMQPGTVVAGEELIIFRQEACYRVNVESLEVDHIPSQRLEVATVTNVGMRLSGPAKLGSGLFKIRNPSPQDLGTSGSQD